MADFSPSLNDVKIKSPTEDGKLAYLANTMVPRRLDQFDDIRNDLANKNFNTDKAFFYVNFQAGDFCGRSYKLPLSELNEFVSDSLLFGTNGKEPTIGFDNNFFIDDNNEIHLLLGVDGVTDPEMMKRIEHLMDESSPDYDYTLLLNVINELKRRNNEQDMNIFTEVDNRILADTALDEKKQDKFVILGDGDSLDSEGLPTPAEGTSGYGVHVTYTENAGPVIDEDGNRGYEILISHDAVVPAGGWVSKYAIGGIAVDQRFPEGTKITEV